MFYYFLSNLKTEHSEPDLWLPHQHPSLHTVLLLRRKVASPCGVVVLVVGSHSDSACTESSPVFRQTPMQKLCVSGFRDELVISVPSLCHCTMPWSITVVETSPPPSAASLVLTGAIPLPNCERTH